MSIFKWTSYSSTDTAVAGTSLNALAIAAYAYGAEIDNSTDLYQYADLAIALSGAVTSVSPAYLSVFLLPNVDGNYTAASGNPGASQLVGTWTGPGGSIQYLQVRGIIVPQKFKIVIQNNLGVAFPSTSTSTCILRRYSEQVV